MREPSIINTRTGRRTSFPNATDDQLQRVVAGRVRPVAGKEDADLDIAARYASILLKERGQ